MIERRRRERRSAALAETLRAATLRGEADPGARRQLVARELTLLGWRYRWSSPVLRAVIVRQAAELIATAKDAGITRDEVGWLLGVSTSTVYRWGRAGPPRESWRTGE